MDQAALFPELHSLLEGADQIEGGKSITPLRYEISYPQRLWRLYRAGLDEFRVVFSVSGD